MSLLAPIALTIVLLAFFQIVRILIRRPEKQQSLIELECEMMSLDAECALALQRSREESSL